MIFRFDNSYRRLPAEFHAVARPTPVRAPGWIHMNRQLASELGLTPEALDSAEGLSILSGNAEAAGSEPIATAYSGHQFGGFAPQLGDGRAILLGEVVAPSDQRFDIQLKGCGQTPFSRRGDGRSALGPVLREYIVSEAMAALGVPTTRALAAITTGEEVLREGLVPGGILTRVARSHIRIGTFQWFASRKDHANLRILADYVLDRLYPELSGSAHPYRALLDAVIERQADLVSRWMQIGFIHGVMNTDNMNISGETIDYGPCAFLDAYHPARRFSSIDHQGRYAFANQGPIAHWNLTRFAETLLPLLHEDQDTAVAEARTALDRFPYLYETALQKRFAAKIGLAGDDAGDGQLAEELLSLMASAEADFTLVFRHLPAALDPESPEAKHPSAANGTGPLKHLLMGQFAAPEGLNAWLPKWRTAVAEAGRNSALMRMREANPIFIPRNHQIEAAIQAGNAGDFGPFHRLNEVLSSPCTERPEFKEYESAPTPDELVQATFCGT